jgi:hypothetical protein
MLEPQACAKVENGPAMKTTFWLRLSVAASLGCFALNAVNAAEAPDRVKFADRKVWVYHGARVTTPTNKVELPFAIVVNTNGTYKVKGGRDRQLLEGDALSRDGTLIRADGSIMPVLDHVTLNRGRVMLMKDGVYSEVTSVMRLGNGTTVAPDWTITTPDGNSRKLLDGELLRLEGAALPAQDTVNLRNGRVTVQKDGSVLTVEPGRTVMMNDGTKVFSDGTVVRFDGETTKLTDGQTLIIEGVVRKRGR